MTQELRGRRFYCFCAVFEQFVTAALAARRGTAVHLAIQEIRDYPAAPRMDAHGQKGRAVSARTALRAGNLSQGHSPTLRTASLLPYQGLMMFFRLLASLFLVTLLGGCVGTPHPMRMPPDDPGAARLIVGMYTSPGGDAWPRSVSFDVYHASSAEPMSLGYFRSEGSNRYHSIAVRPGEYEIRNVQISLVGNHHIRARQPFAVRFKVEPGKAFYLGDYRILCKKSPNFGAHPACGLFLNTLDAEQEAKVRERFPGIGEIQQAELQNLDSAYPIIRVELAAMIRRLQELGALPKGESAQPLAPAKP